MASESREIRELKQQVKQLTDVVNDNKDLKDNLAGVSNIIGINQRTLRRIAREAGKNARHFLSEKGKQAEEAREKFEEAVTSNPFKSIAAAVAGGLLIGALLRRSK